MTGPKTYLRMLSYVRPKLPLLAATMLLSFVIVSLDGAAMWFLGTLPQILFKADAQVPQWTAFSLQNINAWLKFWTYRLVYGGSFGSPLLITCLLVAVTYTSKNVIQYLNRMLTITIQASVVQDIRDSAYHHLLRLPIPYFDRTESGRIVSMVINDIAMINNSITTTLSSMITEPMRLILFIGIMMAINAKLAVFIFLLYPVLGVLINWIGKSIRRRSNRELQSFSDLISVITESMIGIRIIKMFRVETKEKERFNRANGIYCNRFIRSEQMRSLSAPTTETLSMYLVAFLLFFGGSQALHGHAGFTGEDFIRFLIMLVASYQPIKVLAGVWGSVQTGMAAADRVFANLDLPVEPAAGAGERDRRVPFEQSVELRNVNFSYPGRTETVLRNVSIRVAKGNVVALVGPSGAGKSTILDLLPRFYEPSSGAVLIDGADAAGISLPALRSLFGIVSQENVLFNDTVTANIGFIDATPDPSRVRAAAAAANALEFIEKLPTGFDTVIGERGVMLSGGQRQRLAIARALYRDAPILILDEATSSLDTESERLVQEAIDRLMKDRTCIVVAHRLSTVRHADRIVVIDKGEIIEEGAHAELMAKSGRYRTLYDIQFSGHAGGA